MTVTTDLSAPIPGIPRSEISGLKWREKWPPCLALGLLRENSYIGMDEIRNYSGVCLYSVLMDDPVLFSLSFMGDRRDPTG